MESVVITSYLFQESIRIGIGAACMAYSNMKASLLVQEDMYGKM